MPAGAVGRVYERGVCSPPPAGGQQTRRRAEGAQGPIAGRAPHHCPPASTPALGGCLTPARPPPHLCWEGASLPPTCLHTCARWHRHFWRGNARDLRCQHKHPPLSSEISWSCVSLHCMLRQSPSLPRAGTAFKPRTVCGGGGRVSCEEPGALTPRAVLVWAPQRRARPHPTPTYQGHDHKAGLQPVGG